MASRGAGVYNLTRFTEKILKRTRKDTPSLLMHLYTDYFRLGDHNDVRYSYDGDLKGWIPFIREQRMPNELLDVLDEAGVKFFDGCLIVEVYDHRSGEKGKGDIKTPPGPPNGAAATAAVPAAPAEQPDMYRILLSPTGETLWRDLQLMNETKAAQWAATANAKKRDHKWKPMTEEEAVEVEAAIIVRLLPFAFRPPLTVADRNARRRPCASLLPSSPPASPTRCSPRRPSSTRASSARCANAPCPTREKRRPRGGSASARSG